MLATGSPNSHLIISLYLELCTYLEGHCVSVIVGLRVNLCCGVFKGLIFYFDTDTDLGCHIELTCLLINDFPVCREERSFFARDPG